MAPKRDPPPNPWNLWMPPYGKRGGGGGWSWPMWVNEASWNGEIFCSPPRHPTSEGESPTLGFWGWSNTWHLTLDRWDGQQLLVTYSHSPEEEDTKCHAGPHGGCTQEWVKQNGLWEAGRLCSNRRVWYPLVPKGDCDWFVWIISQAVREAKPVRLRTGLSEVQLIQLIGGLTSWDSFLLDERKQLGLWGPVSLKDIEGAHEILGLTLQEVILHYPDKV